MKDITDTRSKMAGLLALLLLAGLALGTTGAKTALAAGDSRVFPETGHTVSGKFLDYWNNNGGLAVFGYPITDAQNEMDSETGKVYLTQWFERNSFQLHPEFAGTRYEVELGLLSKRLTANRLKNDPAFQPGATKAGFYYFPQTKHYVSPLFYTFWQQNGSLDRLGFPISEEQTETDPATGKAFLAQWFERARLEYHPENAAPYKVELGLLGNEIKGSNPANVLKLLYQSLNNATYQQAYSYWETPTQNPGAFNAWVQGYAKLASVSFVSGPYQVSTGAGNSFAAVPSVIKAVNKDGTTQNFYGCYVTHRDNLAFDQPWAISKGMIQLDTTGASTAALLDKGAGVCASAGVN